jgi:DNA-binding response OmpR family regulator
MQKSQIATFNILIVDDDKPIQRLVYDVLASLGFKNIMAANNGRRAIELMEQHKFDFIITDWRMGDMDGIDIVRFARQDTDSKHLTTPIIMLTGNSEPNYVLTARDTGVNSYLIKPFSAEQLVKRIRTIIEQPVPFVLAPKYHGPDRRHKTLPPPDKIERRKPRKS